MANLGYSTSTNLGLDIVPITNDPENLGDISRLYNAVKLVASAMDTYTGAGRIDSADMEATGTSGVIVQNMCKVFVLFVEDVTAGMLVALDASGNAVKGVAGTVIGWSPIAVTSGNYGEVRLLGLHTAVSGLTPGTTYYASNITPGYIDFGPPIWEGKKVQPVGVALTANSMFFNPQYFAPTVRTLFGGNFTNPFGIGTSAQDHKLLSVD